LILIAGISMTRIRCDRTPAWGALKRAFETEGHAFDLRTAFAAEPDRFERFSQDAPHVFADMSKNLIDTETQQLLLDLARQTGVVQHRDAMFSGQAINRTEQRPVMHWLLRNPALATVDAAQSATNNVANEARVKGLASELAQVHRTLDAMLSFAEAVRADDTITDVVNIGIGGSDLGPQMTVLALDEFVTPVKRFHFVSNVDGHELAAVLKKVKPQSTLFLIASKTFTTIATMTNARSAKAWFEEQGGTDISRHFAALTTNVAAAKAFGIGTSFGFWDWVGGRYSVWSAIGLPLAIAIGGAGFREFLAGAHAMDQHFRSAPLEQNLPVRLGLLDVWYRNFHRFSSRNIAPYHSALKRYPAYLQQLEMESNGKRVDANGEALPYGTAPVLWGEPGTNGQHAYFQMLHQGTDVVPVEFVAVKRPRHRLAGHHELLLANALAQARALMLGKADAGGHKHFPGNRPSTFLLLDELTPASLGALIALQEHRVFVSGAVWGINSFDQWGVELGKVMAKDLAQRLARGDVTGLDGSTAGLLAHLRSSDP
jgi:glucose-6-phosphate isomerase